MTRLTCQTTLKPKIPITRLIEDCILFNGIAPDRVSPEEYMVHRVLSFFILLFFLVPFHVLLSLEKMFRNKVNKDRCTKSTTDQLKDPWPQPAPGHCCRGCLAITVLALCASTFSKKESKTREHRTHQLLAETLQASVVDYTRENNEQTLLVSIAVPLGSGLWLASLGEWDEMHVTIL